MKQLHPFIFLLYFCTTCGIVLFCMNPILIVISLCGAILTSTAFRLRIHKQLFFALTGLVLFCTVSNLLFTHNGMTVLFFLNDRPVTLESIFYGVTAGTMLAALLLWSRLFSTCMTTDRIHALFGMFSAKIALFFSMTLRFIPRFQRQSHMVRMAQKSLGKLQENALGDTLRNEARIFSVMTGWALENGIVTADSMTARGYGLGRRTHYSEYRFRIREWIAAAGIFIPGAITIAGIAAGDVRFQFYPSIEGTAWSVFSVISYGAYGVLCILPGISHFFEVLKWRRLLSKI